MGPARLQKLCAQSSAESEIIAVVDSVKEALHIKLLCEESGVRPPNIPMEIQEDNNACIHLAHNLRGSNQAKHFELRLRFLNEHVHHKNIEFSRVPTTNQLADGFTKPLAMHNFRIFRNWMLHTHTPKPVIGALATTPSSPDGSSDKVSLCEPTVYRPPNTNTSGKSLIAMVVDSDSWWHQVD